MSTLKRKATNVFLEMIEKNIDEKSQSLYRSSINKFKQFMTDKEKIDALATVNSELLDEFVEYLSKSKLQFKTIHNYEGAIITLIRYANNDKHIKAKINISGHKRIEDHRSRDQRKSKQVPLTEEQLNQIYRLKNLTPKEEEARDLFISQCLLGQRISDMPKIFKGDYTIQLTKDKTEIISFCVQKTGEEATLYLFPTAKKIIEKYRDQGFKYFDLFSSDENKIRYAKNQLNTTIKNVCRKANLDTEQNYTTQVGTKLVVQRQKLYALIHTQTARHTFITLMCKLGVPKENVIIATAHTDTKMIDNVYLHETVCERGQRLVESYREIKQSRFFVVETKKQKKHKYNIFNKLTELILSLVKKMLMKS